MRVLANIPNEDCTITIFSWNQKYLIKFEKDNMEQTYKIREMDISGMEEIKALPENKAFMDKIKLRFEAMQQDLYAALFLEE